MAKIKRKPLVRGRRLGVVRMMAKALIAWDNDLIHQVGYELKHPDKVRMKLQEDDSVDSALNTIKARVQELMTGVTATDED